MSNRTISVSDTRRGSQFQHPTSHSMSVDTGAGGSHCQHSASSSLMMPNLSTSETYSLSQMHNQETTSQTMAQFAPGGSLDGRVATSQGDAYAESQFQHDVQPQIMSGTYEQHHLHQGEQSQMPIASDIYYSQFQRQETHSQMTAASTYQESHHRGVGVGNSQMPSESLTYYNSQFQRQELQPQMAAASSVTYRASPHHHHHADLSPSSSGDLQQNVHRSPKSDNQLSTPHVDIVVSSEPPATRNIMVTYLPSTVNESQMRLLFQLYGPIESVKLVVDPDTRLSKSYGFVKYSFTYSAMHAIQYLNGYPLMNKRLKVAYANGESATRNAHAHDAEVLNRQRRKLEAAIAFVGTPAVGV